MNNKFSLLLPTRGRPHLLANLFESIVNCTSNLKNIEIVLYIDDDDTDTINFKNEHLNIIKIIGPPTSMGEYNMKCLDASSGNIIVLMNDDLILRTPGWDQTVSDLLKDIPDGIFLAYPNDMETKQNMCTFPIMSRKTCDILVNPYPKEYNALYIDVHLFDLFTRLKHLGQNRMFYLDDIIFEHKHFVDGKVRPDASYSHKNRFKDAMTFISLRHTRQLSAQRLMAAINDDPLPHLPQPVFVEPPTKNLLKAASSYFYAFMLDRGLPLKRRFILFVSFTKYYAAMKSGFSFLKRKSYTLYGD
ncbi:hypothetical protein ACFL0O_04685 [Thermodesulfobacteriota bacterium]